MNTHPFALIPKMACHGQNLAAWLEGDTFPFQVEVMLTDKCNLHCAWCFCHSTRDRAELQREPFMQFAHDFMLFGGKGITFAGGGEPTCCSYFEDAMRRCAELGLDVGLLTNGVMPERLARLCGDLCAWVRVSLDTTDRDDYALWKGKGLPSAIRTLLAIREGTAKLGVCVNVGSWHTVAGVTRLMRIVRDVVDYVQFRPVYAPGALEMPDVAPGPDNPDVWDYLASLDDPLAILSNDKLSATNAPVPFRACEGHHFCPVLDTDGSLRVCIAHPGDDRFAFGNIYDNDYAEIWQSQQRQDVLDRLRNEIDYATECSPCCKLWEVNRVLETLRQTQSLPDLHFL
jgi:GTP 3',8-cyclase